MARKAPPRGWEFIDLAGLGINTARSYVAALARIILYPLAVAAVLGAAAGFVRAPEPTGALLAILLQFGPIVVAGMAVVRSVGRSHQRSWRTLIAADRHIDWRRLAIGLGAELAILACPLALLLVLTGKPLSFSVPALPVVALAILLIPLQAASEEILFRGYLTQALGRIVRCRVVIAAMVGLIFGLLHLNAHGRLTVPYFLVFSLTLSLVSLRDDRLELAIGGHSATNLFAFAVANSSLLGPGVVGGDPAAPQVPFTWASIGVLVINGALFYGITRLLVRVFCKPRSPI